MKDKSIHAFVPAIAGVLSALAVFFLITNYIATTISRVVVVGSFPAGTSVQVSSLKQDGTIKWTDKFSIEGEPSQQSQKGGTSRLNLPTGKLKLQFRKNGVKTNVHRSDIIVLHNIQIPMPYSRDLFVGHRWITKIFSSPQLMVGKTNIFKFDADNQITIVSKSPLGNFNPILSIGISLAIGIGIWLILKNSRFSDIPAIRDMSLGKKISSKDEFDAINGVRGLAALLVLFSHTAPGFFAIQMGLALLFVISGFLLSKPFVLDANKIYNWTNVEHYLTKRLKRILPMYFFYVFITYVITFKFEVALRHFLFIQGEGHLWPMTQIFTFYMLLPMVLLLTCSANKLNRVLPLILLTVAIYLWLEYLSRWMPYFSGNSFHPFYLHTFLIGVLSSYIYYGFILPSAPIQNWLQNNGYWFSLITIIVVVLSIAWSAPVRPPAWLHPYISQFHIKSMLAALIIILTLMSSKSWLSYITSNWLFRSVGVVGFSFYLLHGLGMDIATQLNNYLFQIHPFEPRSWPFMLMTFCITYPMAIITYSYVERPFFGYRGAK